VTFVGTINMGIKFAKHATFIANVLNSDDETSHVPVDTSVLTVNVSVIILVLVLLLILALQLLKLIKGSDK
jgi:hypothetical protein